MPTSLDKPPILFLGTQMARAGAQEVLLTQARWFHAQGYSVQVAFFYDKEGLQEEWLAAHPFPIHNLRAWRWDADAFSNILRLLPGLLRLWFLLRRERVQIVEAFTPHSNVLGLPVAWLARVSQRIATHHGYIEGASQGLARAHGWLVSSGLATHMVAVSERVRRIAIEEEGARAERVSVITNGIELADVQKFSKAEIASLRASLDVPESTLLALTVGRLMEQKGHTYLLDAIPQILQQCPDVVFAFAGEGPLRAELEAKASELGISEAIRFLGLRDDIPSLLQAADIFLMPSLWEGLPIAMLEAMRATLPIVVSEVEGVEDVIVDGRNGVLVASKDVPGLAAAVIKLLKDPQRRVKLGEAGRETLAVEYTVERMCKQYEALFLNQNTGDDRA
ncbi:MAG: glycosyltransferase family 1 protein [Chloroflexi bacterium]|nr:MAG: glycosyltransferase family 1 protein [Chloroflexota bacterium]MBL1193179.1 glycosyltransferase family 1 protein [Chloroflexota bacterium]NOH10472.1 glycosyltransferase family 4 protein [Chloroflexota bacterium]